MAPVPLGIFGLFRPWKQSGISHLLVEDTTYLEQHYSVKEQGSSFEKKQVGAFSNITKKQCYGNKINSSQESILSVNFQKTQGQDFSPYTNGLEKDIKLPVLPVEKWPHDWKILLKNTPKTPRILWTYEELGCDLTGNANPAHRKLLQQLIEDMQLPKGSHAFWPLCLFPDKATAFENAQMFISGIYNIAPEWIIFMTRSIPKALGLPSLCLFVPEIFWGRFVLFTQHIDELLQDELRYSQVLGFLKKHVQGSVNL